MGGCIGALDGWVVRITCPSACEVPNAGRYYSRKGYYAINVQVIVDKKKRVLWRYIGEKGSSHDSPIFMDSKLGRYMESNSDMFERNGWYIVGDSAYSLRSYLLTPYDNTQSNTKEDNFNYYQSSARISVECTFGEVDRRWGVLWRPLKGLLSNHKNTIDACLRLHNFIIDCREGCIEYDDGEISTNLNEDCFEEEFGEYEDKVRVENEEEELNLQSDDFVRDNPYETLGVIKSHLDEYRQRGRKSFLEVELREKGKIIRDNLTKALQCGGFLRLQKTILIRRDRHYRPMEAEN